MKFKQQLINQLKEYPGVYNEIRAEILVSKLNPVIEETTVDFITNPNEDQTLEEVSDLKLVESIINNLKYYIEYEREMGESDV